MSGRDWLHDAYPERGTDQNWIAVCDTCDVWTGSYATRADATLAAAHHIRSRRPAGKAPPLPEAVQRAVTHG